MSRLGFGLALGLFFVLAAPSAASRAAIPSAALRVAIPAQGDVSVADAVFRLQGARISRSLHPRLRLLNGSQLGSDVVVVASVRQERKDRRRLDLTAAVIRRRARTLSAHSQTSAAVDALLVVDEPDLRMSKPPMRLVPAASVVSTNVLGGNLVPRYPSDCDSSKASFLFGDHTGFPGPETTLSFSCGLALDQVWMPLSFASAIGADWCDGLIGTAEAGSTTYPAGFGCNFTVNAFAVQDPGKSIGVSGLSLAPPLTGSCKAPFQQTYIGLCSLTNLQPANIPAAFTMTLASSLPVGGEFGLTLRSGNTQRNMPMREIDALAAARILTDLMNKYPGYANFTSARDAVTTGRLAAACEIIQRDIDLIETGQQHKPGAINVSNGLHEALKNIDCDRR